MRSHASGEALIQELTEKSGIDCESLRAALKQMLVNFNIDPATVTLDELRSVLEGYLHEVFQEL